MKKRQWMMMVTLIGALSNTVVVVASDQDNDSDSAYPAPQAQRQQIHLDMMHMLSETMAILRDLDHRPSDSEKQRLNEMIEQLDRMRASFEQMGTPGMGHRGGMMNERRPHSTMGRDW